MSRQRQGLSDRDSRTNFFMSKQIGQHIVRIIVPCFLVGAAISGCASVYRLPPAPTVGADDPRAVQPERPSVATHAGTVAPGYVEIESGIERDAILSRITGTQAGQLNYDFYIKIAGYGALPVIGLLASQFPSISKFLYSWVTPALEALK